MMLMLENVEILISCIEMLFILNTKMNNNNYTTN